jgi:phosphomannomutase
VDEVLEKIKAKYASEKINTADGVKIDFEKEKEWVHLRKSNTEPIIRIYAESENEKKADELAKKIIREIQDVIKN